MGIERDRLRKSFPRADGTSHLVLDLPRLDVANGEAVCLVGGSGTGKTTLLNVIAGIVLPDEGRVLIDGTDVAALSEAGRDRFRARHVGYVFQVFNLLQGYSAAENVLLPMCFAGLGAQQARARAHELLARVGLGKKAHHRPAALSVGEQQRVALARAVACHPIVLLADEPTANLDPANADNAMLLLREVARENGSILIVVTHDERLRSAFQRVEILRAPS